MKILKLESSVINRIASGEIIQRPVDAVKEMVENSLDAGSKNINIAVTRGGLGLIKINDDGNGICADDLALVCQRHATSKMKEVSDLDTLVTHGFRGEALASISNVSFISVVTKTKNNLYGYQANYLDGKLLDKPKIRASKNGTTIIVQNLFVNMSQRRKAFKSEQTEYNRIKTCIQNYAIHYYKLGLSLKKENVTELSYLTTQDQINRVNKVFGERILSKIKQVEHNHIKYKCRILFSDITEGLFARDKKNIFILFVNNRLVENARIKKQLYQVYDYKKTGYKPPFLYVSLDVDPHHVDVNVHPTKKEVHLLNEEEITDSLCQLLHSSIQTIHSKKNLMAVNMYTLDHYFKSISKNTMNNDKDIRNKKLSYFHQEVPEESASELRFSPRHQKDTIPSEFNKWRNLSENAKKVSFSIGNSKKSSINSIKGAVNIVDMNTVPSTTREVEDEAKNLGSIHTIKTNIKNAEEKKLSKLFAGLQHIDYIDSNLAVSSYRDRYYFISPSVISEEFFYQTTICQFGQFGLLKLSIPISIYECLKLFNQDEKEIANLQKTIINQRDILRDYFKLSITLNGQITTLPMLAKDYAPSLDKIPFLLYNIATQVEWEVEVDCLEALAREFGLFYSITSKKQWEQVIRLFHQKIFQAPKYVRSSGYLIELDIPLQFFE